MSARRKTSVAPCTCRSAPGEEKLDVRERFTQQLIDDLFDKAFGKLKEGVTNKSGVGNAATGDLPREILH